MIDLLNINKLKKQKEELQNEISFLETKKKELKESLSNLSEKMKTIKISKDKLENQLIKREDFFIETELKYIDTLPGLEFEDYCCSLLQQLGYEAAVTKASQDDGGDIISKKEGVSYIIQCKNYSTPVGNKAIQEVYTAKGIYKTDNAIVMTNNIFTAQAKKEADILQITLWDRDYLKLLLASSYHLYISTLMDEEIKEPDIKKDNIENNEEVDPLLLEAIESVIEIGQASTSFIQRRFKIGYARAGRILDQMEARGIISGYEGSKPRKVLMKKEKWNQIKDKKIYITDY